MKSKIFPYVMVGLAGIVLLVLGMMTLLMSVLVNWSPALSTTSTSKMPAVTTPVQDPLITVVPEDQLSASSKTKVFISQVDPIIGSHQAKVFVILFGDWSDSTAQTYVSWAKDVVSTHSDNVAFVWKDDMDPEQLTESLNHTALTAHCLNEQGVFWDLVGKPNFMDTIKEANIDHGGLDECVTSKAYQAAIHYGYYYGQSVGVTNGHTLFINDDLYANPLTKEELNQKIEDVLAQY